MSILGRKQTPVVLTPVASRREVMDAAALDFPFSPEETDRIARGALDEDHAFDDITTISTVLSYRRARGAIVARARGILAGIPIAIAAFRVMDETMSIRIDVPDGSALDRNSHIVFLSGHARAILSAERVALNYLQRLSGVATLTKKYVEAVKGTGARIMDTRKTTPGLRVLEKYAVRAGGGFNHRMGLGDAVLIKDNHLVAVDGNIAKAVKRAREQSPEGTKVEVECETADQVRAAVDAGADVVMLDNMPLDEVRSCVELAKGKAIIEASGGVTLYNVRSIAECGVDWISVGAITHSPPALDLALDFDPV